MLTVNVNVNWMLIICQKRTINAHQQQPLSQYVNVNVNWMLINCQNYCQKSINAHQQQL